MTQRELASVALKLLGVYAVLQAIFYLEAEVGFGFFLNKTVLNQTDFGAPAAAGLLILGFIPCITAGAIGALLIVRTQWFARRLFRDDRELDLSSTLSSEDVQAVAFAVVGVLVLLLAIPRTTEVLSQITSMLQIGWSGVRDMQMLFQTYVTTFGVFAQVTLGVLLFFKAQGLAHFWHRLQRGRYVKVGNGGTPEDSERRCGDGAD